MDGHRLVVAAERLTDGDRRLEPSGGPEPGHRPGEGERQRSTVGHHVDDAGIRSVRPQPGENGRQRRVEVGDDDGHPVDPLRLAQDVVVRAVLLVDGEEHLLHRRVAGLDDVARPELRGVGGEMVRDRDDEGEPSRARAP